MYMYVHYIYTFSFSITFSSVISFVFLFCFPSVLKCYNNYKKQTDIHIPCWLITCSLL